MNFIISGLAAVIDIILTLYMWVIIISALLTWVNPDPYNPIVRTLRALTEPLYYKIRRVLPFLRQGMLDLTPFALILIIIFLQHALVGNLRSLAH